MSTLEDLLEDLNKKPGVTKSIVRTLEQVLTDLTDLVNDNGVKVKTIKVTAAEEGKKIGLEVTLVDDGHGDSPKSPSNGCVYYDLDGLPYWGPCPKKVTNPI